MADICSTIAGVASLIDVALRGCSVLYDSINHLTDAPELSLRLRRTVQSVESILRCLDSFVADYRKQQISTGVPSLLPDALDHELTSIKAELDALSILLPTANSSSQLRRRLKWVLDRKQLAEIVRRLDGHQITLILALQSFAQRNDISVDAQLLGRLAQIERQHKDIVEDLRQDLHLVSTGLHAELDVITQACAKTLPTQGHLDATVKDLHHLVRTGQNAASEKLDAIGDSLSQMRVGHDYVQSSTVLAASTEDVLARVVRAELQRVVMPTVKQCFNSLSGDSESQLKEIRRKIDEMALQVGSKFADMKQETIHPPRDSLLGVCSEQKRNHQDQADLAAFCGLDIAEPSFAKPQSNFPRRPIRHWRRCWIFRWTIGTLWVRVMTTTTRRKTSSEDRIGESPSSRRAYQIIIEFQPAQALIQLRGLTLSVTNTQDQRGYSQICPFISTFAVVPWTAKIMEFSTKSHVEGIRELFERRLAAPSDRSSRACRLLLNEGSDPLATDEHGCNSFVYANTGFIGQLYNAEESLPDDKNYVGVIESLLRAESNVMENSQPSFLWYRIVKFLIEKKQVGWSIDTFRAYNQRLKELGYTLQSDEYNSSLELSNPALTTGQVDVRRSLQKIERSIGILIDIGVDIYAVDRGGTLLHFVMCMSRPTGLADAHDVVTSATALLKHGVDPCALDCRGRSIFNIAEEFNDTAILWEALQQAGYDVDVVQTETKRRQWCFNNSDHAFAETTAVNRAQVAPPSGIGLVLRKSIRRDRFED
ncbi:MAG: hypothetical protein Q9193_002080 [Seirophora villosa]